jgi:hypothetical protein
VTNTTDAQTCTQVGILQSDKTQPPPFESVFRISSLYCRPRSHKLQPLKDPGPQAHLNTTHTDASEDENHDESKQQSVQTWADAQHKRGTEMTSQITRELQDGGSAETFPGEKSLLGTSVRIMNTMAEQNWWSPTGQEEPHLIPLPSER